MQKRGRERERIEIETFANAWLIPNPVSFEWNQTKQTVWKGGVSLFSINLLVKKKIVNYKKSVEFGSPFFFGWNLTKKKKRNSNKGTIFSRQ